MACLDTSVIVDLLGRGGRRRQAQARARLHQLVAGGESLATTRFSQAELWVGVERSRDPNAEAQAVRTCLADLEMLEFSEPAALAFGEISAYLQARGQPAGDMDVLIASVAVVNAETLVTRNPRHFVVIPGLVVESY